MKADDQAMEADPFDAMNGEAMEDAPFAFEDDEAAVDSLLGQIHEEASNIEAEDALNAEPDDLLEEELLEEPPIESLEGGDEPPLAHDEMPEEPEERKSTGIILLGFLFGIMLGLGVYYAMSDDEEAKPLASAPFEQLAPVQQRETAPLPAEQPAPAPASEVAPIAAEVARNAIDQAGMESTEPAPIEITPAESPAAMEAEQPEPAIPAGMPVMDHLIVDPVTHEITSPHPDSNTFAWAVNLISFSRLSSAIRMQQQLAEQGTRSELVWISIGESSYYRVRIGDFASEEDAGQQLETFRQRPLFATAWVSRYRK